MASKTWNLIDRASTSSIILFIAVFVSGGLSFASPIPGPHIEEGKRAPLNESGPLCGVAFARLPGASMNLLDCIHRATQDALPRVNVISARFFQDSTFPWFEPNRIPDDAVALRKLILSPAIKRHIDALRISHLVFVGGSTDIAIQPWGGVLGGPPGGAVIIGGLESEQETTINATIIELKNIDESMEMDITEARKNGFGFVILFPYYHYADSKLAACQTFSERIVVYLNGEGAAACF